MDGRAYGGTSPQACEEAAHQAHRGRLNDYLHAMEAVNPADSGGHRAADHYLEAFTLDNIINNEIHGKIIYKYNNTDFFSSSENYNKSGEKRNETIYKRDEIGRIISITNKNAEGKVMGLSKYIYGEHFEPISIDAEIAQGKKINRTGKREVEFDENGNWIKVVRYRDGEPRNMTFRTYKFYED